MSTVFLKKKMITASVSTLTTEECETRQPLEHTQCYYYLACAVVHTSVLHNLVASVVRMSTTPICKHSTAFSTVRSRMDGDINVNRTRSTAHGEYGATVLHET